MKYRNITTVCLLRHCYKARLSILKATTQYCSSLFIGALLQNMPKACYRSHQIIATEHAINQEWPRHRQPNTIVCSQNIAIMMKKPCQNPTLSLKISEAYLLTLMTKHIQRMPLMPNACFTHKCACVLTKCTYSSQKHTYVRH